MRYGTPQNNDSIDSTLSLLVSGYARKGKQASLCLLCRPLTVGDKLRNSPMRARSRIIQPGFFTNETLADLPFEYRLLFAGLWTIADREGRLEDRPKRIKIHTLPYDDVDIDSALSELHEKRFIHRYSHNGSEYIQILGFTKHQSVHHKEEASQIPEPQDVHTYLNQGPSTTQASPVLGSSTKVEVEEEVEVKVEEEEGNQELIRLIIEDLNLVTGSDYRPKNKDTASKLNARIQEGFTLEDFQAVHRNRYQKWAGTDQQQYLRPSTLYSQSKFEGYLQDARRNLPTLPEKQRGTAVAAMKWLNKENANGQLGQTEIHQVSDRPEFDLPDGTDGTGD